MDADRVDNLRKAILGDDAASMLSSAKPKMLDIRPKRGGWLALPYLAIRNVRYDPDASPPLVIEFSSHVVEVEGRKLEGVYIAVTTQRASVLSEASELYMEDGAPGACIDRLTIRKKRARDESADDRERPRDGSSGRSRDSR